MSPSIQRLACNDPPQCSLPYFFSFFLVPGNNIVNQSVQDIVNQFKTEYPQDDLISVPCVKLQDYKSVPYHVTGHDIRTNIEKEEEEILKDRISQIRAKKVDMSQALAQWGFQNATLSNAATVMNDMLFPFLFVGDNNPYPQLCKCFDCSIKICTDKKSNKCNINLGFHSPYDRAKSDCKHKWTGLLNSLVPNNVDGNFIKVLEFTEKEIKAGIKRTISQEIQGIAGNMKGRQSENELATTLETLFKGKPGLLLGGFKVKKYLKSFIDSCQILFKGSNIQTKKRII